MKTKTLTCLAALTGLLAAEPLRIIDFNQLPDNQPASSQEPHASARMAVITEIVARLGSPKMPPFSRAMPVTPRAVFQPVQLADAEERLPFTVSTLGREAAITGYVRLSDNAIFIHRPETKDHIRSTLDPRFAPPGKTRIEPQDPA